MRCLIAVFTVIFVIAQGASQKIECSVHPKEHIETCCDGFLSFWDESKFEGCKLETLKKGEEPTCEMYTCVLDKHGIVTDKKIDKTKALIVAKARYNTDWSATAVNATEKCFTDLQTYKGDCESKEYITCFMRALINMCPDKLWADTKDCRDSRIHANQCPLTEILLEEDE